MTDNVTPLPQPGALPRVPPINIEAEQHLLDAFLCNNRLLEVVTDFLKPEHFANAMLASIDELLDRLERASMHKRAAGEFRAEAEVLFAVADELRLRLTSFPVTQWLNTATTRQL